MFQKPGHIFPIKYKEGGVLVRAGHTEASVDLSKLAGLKPAAVMCEIVKDDGTMARRPDLEKFALENDIKIITIADLIAHRYSNETIVKGLPLLNYLLNMVILRRWVINHCTMMMSMLHW